MDIINHPLCTHSIGAPTDMAEPACSPLPVALHTDQHGTWSVSFWKPSDEDVETLKAGGGVALHVRASGRQHPVVGLGVWPALDSADDTNIGDTAIHTQAALAAKVHDQAAELRAEEAIRADLVAALKGLMTPNNSASGTHAWHAALAALTAAGAA